MIVFTVPSEDIKDPNSENIHNRGHASWEEEKLAESECLLFGTFKNINAESIEDATKVLWGLMTKQESIDTYSLLINKASNDCTDSSQYKYTWAKRV